VAGAGAGVGGGPNRRCRYDELDCSLSSAESEDPNYLSCAHKSQVSLTFANGM
jgi:hypothetical protein